MQRYRMRSIRHIIIIFAASIGILQAAELPANSQVSEQERKAPRPVERIYLGGNFGLQLGTFNYIEVSPVVGYWLFPRVAVAAGPVFKYYSDSAGNTDVWGWRGYSRLVVINDLGKFLPFGFSTSIYAHGEYEYLSFQSSFLGYTSGALRTGIDTGLIGFGISQPAGRKSSVNITILWSVYDSGYQIYNNPDYRIEFVFGL